MRARSLFPVLLLALAPLAVGACASDDGSAAAGSSTAAQDVVRDADDVMFLQMMIPHHGQALEMADLALQYAQDERVRALAERIRAAQDPEIQQMQGWLRDGGHDVPNPTDRDTGGHAGHGGGMAGMLSDEQMTALRAARGHDFDHLFLTGMVAHHEGAVDMAKEVLSSGASAKVAALARAIDEAQRAEVREMKALIEEISSHDGH